MRGVAQPALRKGCRRENKQVCTLNVRGSHLAICTATKDDYAIRFRLRSAAKPNSPVPSIASVAGFGVAVAGAVSMVRVESPSRPEVI
jgi:hypothetical protein